MPSHSFAYQATETDGTFSATVEINKRVFDADEQFLTTVIDSGKVFLSNEQLSEGLWVRLDNNKRCLLDYSLPDKADPNVYFESADATCTPL